MSRRIRRTKSSLQNTGNGFSQKKPFKPPCYVQLRFVVPTIFGLISVLIIQNVCHLCEGLSKNRYVVLPCQRLRRHGDGIQKVDVDLRSQ